MRTFVANGPGIMTVSTAEPEQLIALLNRLLAHDRISNKPVIDHPDEMGCLLFFEGDEPNNADAYLAFQQSSAQILSTLINHAACPYLKQVHTKPPVILFNALGDVATVIAQIQTEFAGKRLSLGDLSRLKAPDDNQAIIAFLTHNETEEAQLYHEFLQVEASPIHMQAYLRIHAARYMAKAFPEDAWHMVEVRVFDRYQAYDLQYKRLVEGIQGLDLGYIVAETWDRDVPMFGDPVGTYLIRLLTFHPPIELKKWLIGLEYAIDGERVVDLDLFHHKKRISWQNVLDDKKTRQEIKGDRLVLPTSSFFAVQNEKKLLIEYMRDKVLNTIKEENFIALKTYTKAIRNDFWV